MELYIPLAVRIFWKVIHIIVVSYGIVCTLGWYQASLLMPCFSFGRMKPSVVMMLTVQIVINGQFEQPMPFASYKWSKTQIRFNNDDETIKSL